jgi:integrase
MRGVSKIQWNPCQIEGAQKAPTQHQARPASVAELQTIIDNMMERYQLPIALMGWCALRFGETVALERADVDVVRRSIQIKKGVVRVEGERRLDTPKNRRMRVVHYPPRRHGEASSRPLRRVGQSGQIVPESDRRLPVAVDTQRQADANQVDQGQGRQRVCLGFP